MLDEFPALGRLDFFESALAFVAGYGIKSFLIAQSLNQIEKAYGPNNSILDNCHVRIAFATNDERTAHRVSQAMGTATELRAMRNYAGHRLSPWLSHLMVSRQETARQLLTPGEIMQLPPNDELVLVSSLPPIRARKARYYEDAQLSSRILPLPSGNKCETGREGTSGGQPPERHDDWTRPLSPNAEPDAPIASGLVTAAISEESSDADNAGIHREPTLPAHEAITAEQLKLALVKMGDDEHDIDDIEHNNALPERMVKVARQAAMDPEDGLGL